MNKSKILTGKDLKIQKINLQLKHLEKMKTESKSSIELKKRLKERLIAQREFLNEEI